MSLPHDRTRRLGRRAILLTVVGLMAGIGLIEQAAADEAPLASLRAPFPCGTEWAGGTRSGHGLNDWNLDINSTARTFADPNHDVGTPLLAQADGTVVWVGTHSAAGTYVEIDYGDITAVYVHLVAGSVPDVFAVGSPIAEGQQFGELGGSGNATHAHLHLEYFDSRDEDDSRTYALPDGNQVQIAMDGEPIDPGETFVSTNCDGKPLPPTTTTEAPFPFADVAAGSFAYTDIDLLFDLGVTTGTSGTTYSPDTDVTREQMAAFLGRLWRLLAPDETISPVAVSPFDDVDPDSFAADDISLISALGITTGTSATTYSPDDEVTREQMAAFLGRLWRLVTPEVEVAAALSADAGMPFADVDVASFAHDDVALIAALGITTGTTATTYSPGDEVTREQMAAFLGRLYRLTTADPGTETPVE